MTALLRFFHTVRYLRPVQIFGRVFFRLYRPKIDQCTALERRNCQGAWRLPVVRVQSRLGPDRFRFLNETHEVRNRADWNNPAWSKLWLYNLHYFDDLNAERAAERSVWHEALIGRWIEENPVGQGNGWEPYPISLRVVNWIKWGFGGRHLSGKALHSLALQARLLVKRLEYHLLGNHLFANGKALVFAGLYFEGAEAARWLAKGLDILSCQIREQVLADGGHFERSPMYHAIILEDLLDLMNLMQAYGQAVPAAWKDAAARMLAWFSGMVHPDGEIALLNDAAFGVAPRPAELFAYAERLGVKASGIGGGLKHYASTGYVRVRQGDAVAFLDVAPIGPDYLPGHAHADTLTFELSLFGQRVVVDSGTSCYGDSNERLRQRGTAAHNTVVVNGEDSSEVWSGFRVARRAYPRDIFVEESAGVIRVACSHTGYRRLPGKPVHTREWLFKGNSLQITDRISGCFAKAVGRFHLHPDLKLECHGGATGGSITFADGRKVRFTVAGGRCEGEHTTWHPEFGLTLVNSCLAVEFEAPEVVTVFSW